MKYIFFPIHIKPLRGLPFANRFFPIHIKPLRGLPFDNRFFPIHIKLLRGFLIPCFLFQGILRFLISRNLTISYSLFLISYSLSAQQFYNYEDFFTDANYVKQHKLKSVSITIPAMRSDTMSEIITYQKLCYNSLGKFSWIEHDKMDRKGLKKYFLWHFYDDSARLVHTKLIEKCANQDSLREEEKIRYDDNGKILREEFAQFYVGNYNDWKIDYAWQGDTIKIRYFENDKKDTTLYDAQSGKIISFEQNSWKYKLQYDDKNRIVKSSYYWLNAPFTNDNKIDERTYRYDRYNNLERIESDAWAVIFNNDFEGLPYSSHVIDKNTGKQIGWRVEYAYEFR